MRRREIDMRDALAGAWAASRVAGGHVRSLGPVYVDRAGLAYAVLRGRRLRDNRRMIALTAVLAAAAGAAAGAAAARVIAARRTAPAPEATTADEVVIEPATAAEPAKQT